MKIESKFKCVLILTSCIKPKDIPFLERSSDKDRLNDYKIAFEKWCENKLVDQLILIENSGYDLKFFHDIANNFPEKKIEIISANLNDTFDKSLGKGYGEHLCFKEILNKSKLFNESKFFIKITGRYYVKNYNNIFDEFKRKQSEIFVYIKNNLTYADSHVFGGTTYFFSNYVIPISAKVNDSKNILMENCLAKSVLTGIKDNLSFKSIETYPIIQGIIGTNNKEIKNNIFKRIKLYFFGKLKNYFLSHKKY